MLLYIFSFNNSKSELWYYVGKDSISKLLIKLNELSEQCTEIQTMIMGDADQNDFCNATCCHLCKNNFHKLNYKVRYHDH